MPREIQRQTNLFSVNLPDKHKRPAQRRSMLARRWADVLSFPVPVVRIAAASRS